MITTSTIANLKNNDGLTLKAGEPITYRTGWQVATEGVEVRTAQEAMDAVNAYGGTCGIWLSDGIYYVDKSRRVNTKREALHIGREHKQISVLGWATMKLAYC